MHAQSHTDVAVIVCKLKHVATQVFLAKWKGTPVAVKVLDKEGNALATLGSPVLDKLRAVSASDYVCVHEVCRECGRHTWCGTVNL